MEQKIWISPSVRRWTNRLITDHDKETESDLIYKLKLRRKTVYIYVLLEFQSKVDRFMVLRVLFYILSFYMDYTANYKRIKSCRPSIRLCCITVNANGVRRPASAT